MRQGISKELLEFIALHVDSVELVEVLRLLHSEQTRSWEITDLDAIIRSNAASIENRLKKLLQLGLVAKVSEDPPRFRFAPADEKIGAMANSLIDTYQTRRVEVVELIYTRPLKEIVSFSNAFNLRGGSKKNG